MITPFYPALKSTGCCACTVCFGRSERLGHTAYTPRLADRVGRVLYPYCHRRTQRPTGPRSGVVMRSAPCQVERTPRRTSLPDAALAVELRPVPVQTTAAHRSGQLHFESTGWCSGDSEFTPIRRCLHILFRVRQTLETKTPSHHSSWCEGVFLFLCRGDLRDLVRLSTGSMRWRALYTADREAGASSGSAGK